MPSSPPSFSRHQSARGGVDDSLHAKCSCCFTFAAVFEIAAWVLRLVLCARPHSISRGSAVWDERTNVGLPPPALLTVVTAPSICCIRLFIPIGQRAYWLLYWQNTSNKMHLKVNWYAEEVEENRNLLQAARTITRKKKKSKCFTVFELKGFKMCSPSRSFLDFTLDFWF